MAQAAPHICEFDVGFVPRLVPERFISRVWEVMEKAHWHSFQILTKRAERMREVLRGSSYPILTDILQINAD